MRTWMIDIILALSGSRLTDVIAFPKPELEERKGSKTAKELLNWKKKKGHNFAPSTGDDNLDKLLNHSGFQAVF